MPDAEDLNQAAVLLERTADDVRAINQPVVAASGDDVLSGGLLGAALDGFLADKTAETAAIAAELEALAAEARQLGAAAALAELEAAGAAAAEAAAAGVV